MRKFFIFLLALVLLPVFIALSYPAAVLFFTLTGHYVNENPETLAAHIVQGNEPATDCFKLKVVDFFPSEPTVSRQNRCVRTVAKLKQDARICDILFPGNQILRCIGEALPQQVCNLFGNQELAWGHPGEDDIGNSTLSDCFTTAPISKRGKECCEVAKARYIKKYNSCSTLSAEASDACYLEVAIKFSSADFCSKILNAGERKACDMYLKYKKLLRSTPVFEEKDFLSK